MNTDLGHTEVVKAVKAAIEGSSRKAIDFRAYMELCLYHEPFGYYKNKDVKIGKDGDFYTSSSIGTIMGEMLAAYIVHQVRGNVSASRIISIVEWGEGTAEWLLTCLKR
ncbi:hypothetical protein [Paenibacillus hexagrammi]|uniref:Uncharacterized protein n=1 Tax=Paenibacillus hexagrammi TaxID=2908839 RepID=A0ABY3SMM9_9BACL|nr:hypothetical protein [Paenibacillus sp. YPD9-1]UJF35117.1 hypothetical protein L0M14_08275 [Paenibacillus sp. YPD9-1]